MRRMEKRKKWRGRAEESEQREDSPLKKYHDRRTNRFWPSIAHIITSISGKSTSSARIGDCVAVRGVSSVEARGWSWRSDMEAANEKWDETGGV